LSVGCVIAGGGVDGDGITKDDRMLAKKVAMARNQKDQAQPEGFSLLPRMQVSYQT
jgi:hypothetical protein